MANKHIKICPTSYVLREFLIKITMTYHYTPNRMAKIQTLATPKVGKDVVRKELSCVVRGNTKWHSCCGRQFGGFLRNLSYSKHTFTIQFSTYAAWYFPKLTENLCGHQNLHTSVYSSLSHNCHKLDATKMPSNRWMYKVWYLQTMGY